MAQKIPESNKIHRYTADQIYKLERCSVDVVYFAKNFLKIQHPIRGKILFELYDYQEEMLTEFQEHRFCIALTARQAGKSTIVAAFLLWKAMFNNDFNILIAAHKFKAASEIMRRIKYMYEELPDWLKPGAATYNVQSISFDNGSIIAAEATTESTGRGTSISLLYLDEFAFVDPPAKAKEFWTAIRPTLATGGGCIITSTPNTDEDQFAMIWHDAIKLYDEFGNPTPFGEGINGFRGIKVTWDRVPGRDEKWAQVERASIGFARFESEYNCNFVTFEETLIDAIKLTGLQGKDPLYSTGQVRWYHKPEKNKIFIAAMDPSMGTGGDYAAIQVFQLPEMIQIAEWKHNRTNIPDQVRCLRLILKQIQEDTDNYSGDNIFWSLENNSLGEAANVVIAELGEDQFPGAFLSEPKSRYGGSKRKGYTTTHKSKLQACSRLKNLVERDKITIFSKPLISELKTFVSKGSSFSAKTGEHDDLISALLLTIRLLERVMRYEDALEEQFKESLGEDEGRMPLGIIF